MEPINRYLDHAVLKPEMTTDEAAEAIKLGIQYQVKTVCVRPCDISLAQQLCEGTSTEVCTVLGFPHGCGNTASKLKEAVCYAEMKVSEVDMVANYGWIRSGNWQDFETEISEIFNSLKPHNILLKVILETNTLSANEIRRATEICANIGVDFVKTSTGFNGSGATEAAVKAMLDSANGRIKVKPSGGIRDREKAEFFIAMGVHRLGVGYSSTPAICDGMQPAEQRHGAY